MRNILRRERGDKFLWRVCEAKRHRQVGFRRIKIEAIETAARRKLKDANKTTECDSRDERRKLCWRNGKL